jgi:CheY-like chemotaxis protein
VSRRGETPLGVAAVINSSPDTIDMLAAPLRQAGFHVVSTYTFDIRDGRVDLAAFMTEHRPNVVIYDIAPPYEANWELFDRLRSTPAMSQVPVVITSTNARHLETLAGSDQQIYEVVGKPYDLDRIIQAAKEASRSRPTR